MAPIGLEALDYRLKFPVNVTSALLSLLRDKEKSANGYHEEIHINYAVHMLTYRDFYQTIVRITLSASRSCCSLIAVHCQLRLKRIEAAVCCSDRASDEPEPGGAGDGALMTLVSPRRQRSGPLATAVGRRAPLRARSDGEPG